MTLDQFIAEKQKEIEQFRAYWQRGIDYHLQMEEEDPFPAYDVKNEQDVKDENLLHGLADQPEWEEQLAIFLKLQEI
jgi:hypothetical protein